MTDAERVREIAWRHADARMFAPELQEAIEDALASVRSEATAAAEQRIAALEAGIEAERRIVQGYVATIRKRDITVSLLEAGVERLTRERDELRAELDAEGREWLRTKDIDRLQAAEKERDEARAALEATEDETALANTDAAYERNRANAAEACLARAREALKRARPFVRDAGCDEDPDAACGSCDALKLIDRALADSEPAGRAAPDYEAAARFLFDLLDDIDTAEDVAKADDVSFRKIAHRLHRRRFEVAETDGYKVTFKPAGRAARAAEGDGTP